MENCGFKAKAEADKGLPNCHLNHKFRSRKRPGTNMGKTYRTFARPLQNIGFSVAAALSKHGLHVNIFKTKQHRPLGHLATAAVKARTHMRAAYFSKLRLSWPLLPKTGRSSPHTMKDVEAQGPGRSTKIETESIRRKGEKTHSIKTTTKTRSLCPSVATAVPPAAPGRGRQTLEPHAKHVT